MVDALLDEGGRTDVVPDLDRITFDVREGVLAVPLGICEGVAYTDYADGAGGPGDELVQDSPDKPLPFVSAVSVLLLEEMTRFT